MNEKEFKEMNRKDQEELLNRLRINFTKKDKENKLYEKYEKYLSDNVPIADSTPKPVLVPEVSVEKEYIKIPTVADSTKPLVRLIFCPNCGESDKFEKVREWEYRCGRCGKGYSGFPPPK